mmetsp:Transcript_26732/g.77812  ORF Transcript_26732/g.77812 Transcript_26732/m.77812 type:complete len:340 (-) Transcript_26732:538-1557(-)
MRDESCEWRIMDASTARRARRSPSPPRRRANETPVNRVTHVSMAMALGRPSKMSWTSVGTAGVMEGSWNVAPRLRNAAVYHHWSLPWDCPLDMASNTWSTSSDCSDAGSPPENRRDCSISRTCAPDSSRPVELPPTLEGSSSPAASPAAPLTPVSTAPWPSPGDGTVGLGMMVGLGVMGCAARGGGVPGSPARGADWDGVGPGSPCVPPAPATASSPAGSAASACEGSTMDGSSPATTRFPASLPTKQPTRYCTRARLEAPTHRGAGIAEMRFPVIVPRCPDLVSWNVPEKKSPVGASWPSIWQVPPCTQDSRKWIREPYTTPLTVTSVEYPTPCPVKS